MAIPQEMNHDHELQADRLLHLGLRASWLRLCLANSAAAMTPLDRDLITAVATSPDGVAEHELLARMRHMSPGSAHRWLQHLCATWLSARDVDGLPVIDLPQSDRAWITARVNEIHPCPADVNA